MPSLLWYRNNYIRIADNGFIWSISVYQGIPFGQEGRLAVGPMVKSGYAFTRKGASRKARRWANKVPPYVARNITVQPKSQGGNSGRNRDQAPECSA